ncbi:hypothetical protein [Radiobacillus deserti]|uniref:GGDEF domain-containing protein n=1 Tax=Radiobacillus deserti TaxID=2594883 RepID=A0A516KI83_9BACI|nr:hypothetical protein [Radiobacillus deserti]QDP41103.1 hypothetical protein FN924_13425 [Radiobacillus deserti]
MHQVKSLTTLHLLVTLLLISFLGLFYLSSNDILFLVNLSIILISIIIMNFFSTSRNFIILLSIVLLIGFILLFYGFFRRSSLQVQIDFVIQHIFLTASLIILWLLFAAVKKIQEDVKSLRQRVQELEKWDSTTNVLMPSEFLNRVNVISTGTKRRGETNYYVSFTVHSLEHTKDSMNHVFSTSILQAIRSEFDFVTKTSEHTFLVFLQNTNEQGCNIVINRLFDMLRNQLNFIEIPVSYEIIPEEEMDGLKRKTNGMVHSLR